MIEMRLKINRRFYKTSNKIIFLIVLIAIFSTMNDTVSSLERRNFLVDSCNSEEMEKSQLFTENTDQFFRYVIITNQNLKNSNFQLLKEFKSRYITTTIVTIEEIVNNPIFWVNGTFGDATNHSNGNIWIEDDNEVKDNFSRFNDSAAKIRNFIRYAHQSWKTEYVLLGGDVQIIPVRELYVNISGWDGGFLLNRTIEAYIPSDLYYSALNGTWNDDFDNNFGEFKQYSKDEEADFIAEVYVGRAPVDNNNDVATFVKKVMHFETNEKPKNVLLHQSNLKITNNPDTSVIPDACEQYIKDGYNVHKLYQKNEVISIDKWINAFQYPSKFLILHIGNGYYYGPTNSWYQLYFNVLGRGKFTNFDVGKLKNEYYPIHISISCLSGNFLLNDCIGEELLLWSEGGPSACIFNSEVGCVKSDDVLAYSGEFIERLFFEIFYNKTNNLGKINQLSKENFSSKALTNPNYRWCYYEINLLGDPETPVNNNRQKMQIPLTYVDDNYNSSTVGWNISHFNKIQSAIDSSYDNGVVYVYNGTYNECILINKTIELIGENKHETIINGNDSDTVVKIKTNSSMIKNFTIKHDYNMQNNLNFTGIYIPPKCEGNKIINNIITNNGNSGIYIQDSCRNLIEKNIITNNGKGIYLISASYTLFQNQIIVTCNNKIQNNLIQSNDEQGVYLYSTINNHIIENNFIDNCKSLDFKQQAYFKLCRNNEWDGNFWNKPMTTPKIIFGTMGPLFPHYWDFSNGIIFPQIKYTAIINIGIPFPDFDSNPAQQMYIIE